MRGLPILTASVLFEKAGSLCLRRRHVTEHPIVTGPEVSKSTRPQPRFHMDMMAFMARMVGLLATATARCQLVAVARERAAALPYRGATRELVHRR
jgi:hypothetical protein